MLAPLNAMLIAFGRSRSNHGATISVQRRPAHRRPTRAAQQQRRHELPDLLRVRSRQRRRPAANGAPATVTRGDAETAIGVGQAVIRTALTRKCAVIASEIVADRPAVDAMQRRQVDARSVEADAPAEHSNDKRRPDDAPGVATASSTSAAATAPPTRGASRSPGAGTRSTAASLSGRTCRNGTSSVGEGLPHQASRQRRAIALPSRLRMNADGAQLDMTRHAQTFAGHRHQPVAVADAEIAAKQGRALAERPRLGRRDQIQHCRRVGLRQRDRLQVAAAAPAAASPPSAASRSG